MADRPPPRAAGLGSGKQPVQVSRGEFALTRSATPDRAHRTPELEDWLNGFVFHPLSLRLARLLRPTGMTPNMVSLAGVATVTLAAIAYVRMPWPMGAALGFALHLLWHVVDGADGDLARLRGRVSANGEFVDGVCDYIGHIVLYILFAGLLERTWGGWAWVLIVAAGAAHIVQTNHHESLRRTYLWWAYGVPWLRQNESRGDAGARPCPTWFDFVFGWMARDYLALSAATAPPRGQIDALLEEAAENPALLEARRALVRRHARGIMGYSPWLGSNARTVLLGLCMLAKQPAGFFLCEIAALGLLLASLARSRKAQDIAAAEIRAAGGLA